MQNPFGVFMLILFGGAGLISILSVISLLFRPWIEQTRATIEAPLGRSLLLGLVNFLALAAVDLLFIWLAQAISIKLLAGVLVLLGGVATLTAALLALLGLASLANLLGHRMGDPKDEFSANVRGGTLLFLAGLTPFIGWFAFTPLAIWTCLGAAIQTIFRKRLKAA